MKSFIVKTTIRGHSVICEQDGCGNILKTVLEETGECLGEHNDLPCKKCHCTPIEITDNVKTDYPNFGSNNLMDACFNVPLKDVNYACCGHGIVKDAYVAFTDGNILRGEMALKYFRKIGVKS